MFDKKSRRKVAITLIAIFSMTLLYSTYTNQESLALSALQGLIWIGGIYIVGDTFRKSDVQEN